MPSTDSITDSFCTPRTIRARVCAPRVRALLVASALIAWALGACGGPEAPPPDTCADPTTPIVDTLAIGGQEQSGFAPWTDEQTVALEIGLQGSPMLPFNTRYTGTDASCITQRTLVTNADGDVLADEEIPLRVYVDGDGLLTSTRFLPLFASPSFVDGQLLTAEVFVGDASIARRVYANRPSAVLDSIAPETAQMQVSESLDLAIRFAEPTPAGATLDVESSEPQVLAPALATVEIAQGSTEVVYAVEALSPGTATITVSASASQRLQAEITVGAP